MIKPKVLSKNRNSKKYLSFLIQWIQGSILSHSLKQISHLIQISFTIFAQRMERYRRDFSCSVELKHCSKSTVNISHLPNFENTFTTRIATLTTPILSLNSAIVYIFTFPILLSLSYPQKHVLGHSWSSICSREVSSSQVI